MPNQTLKPRLLTKSRFKMACECPTKLAYTANTAYGNTKDENSFLKALAEGGFQVGALAKLYFPGGHEIESLDYDTATAETEKLLKEPNITLYEAALRHENLFVRVDILEKRADQLFLYEVKAKSFDPEQDAFFQKRSKERKLLSKWAPYLYDIAFQDHVAKKAFPQFTVTPFLYLVNKGVEATVDALNQNFLLRRQPSGHPRVEIKRMLSKAELGAHLLVKVPVDEPIAHIRSLNYGGRSFEQYIHHLAQAYASDTKIVTAVGSQCKGCEFRIDLAAKAAGLKSGFDECWTPLLGAPLDSPLVIDLWDNRSATEQLDAGKLLLTALSNEDIAPEPNDQSPGITRRQRQWLQVDKHKQRDPSPYLDLAGLATVMSKWKYPLHFIDFETTQTAIPLNKGRRPYEPIAFQFSHHMVHSDGRVEHAGEYINVQRGRFPNFDFLKSLKGQLEHDDGTIFRYAAHENTVLCKLYYQLPTSGLSKIEIEELQAWIRSITKKKAENKRDILWEGARCMVDMRELVLRYYFHPMTGGSNSLKYVLPATLNASSYLQTTYSQPIYGSSTGIPSRNFRNKQWIQRDPTGRVLDPYKTLEPIFTPAEDRLIETLYPETDINDGGAAMMAYARMQFTEMDPLEADRITQALLRYCELDTLAMVFLFQYWQSEVLLSADARTG